MKWYRANFSDDTTQQKVDIFSYFFNQKNLDNDEIVTPLSDEGIQNSRDASILKEIINSRNSLQSVSEENVPLIEIKRKKIKKQFFEKFITEDFKKWIKDSQVKDKYYLEKYLEENNEVELLIFEDFNTTGIKGGPSPHKIKMNDGSRNDFYIFLWHVGSPDNKGNDKGGSVGVGRLTFSFSSKINTFFMYTSQNEEENKCYFIGMVNLGQSTNNTSYDPIARFGVEGKSEQGKSVPFPVQNENDLENIKNNFEIRKNNLPGTSMIVPFPEDDLTDENLIKNTINRYRIGLYLNHFKIKIGDILISRETIKTVIKNNMSKQYDSYLEYFDFIDEAAKIEKEDLLFKIKMEENNPSSFKAKDFNEADFEKIREKFNNNEVLGVRIPFRVQELIDTGSKIEIIDHNTHVDVFIKKTQQGNGMDDILRGPMPVSGLRKFTAGDCFALINIQEKKATDFFRSAETPNHKFFENTNKEFTNKYQKFKHQIALISNASLNLKRVIEEGDTNLDSDATSEFFSFGIGDENNKTGEKNKKQNNGKTNFTVPLALFSNPKSFNIKKISKNNLVGFKIDSLNFEEECKKTIKNIDDFFLNNKNNKDFTKKIKKQLESQKEKNIKWLNKENLNELFPCKIYIACADDLEGLNDTSFSLHDDDFDFDFSNNLRHEITEEKNGDISDVEKKGNKIILSVSGPEYSYSLLTDAFNISSTEDKSDLRVKVEMRNYK
jgi:hypothetical protein